MPPWVTCSDLHTISGQVHSPQSTSPLSHPKIPYTLGPHHHKYIAVPCLSVIWVLITWDRIGMIITETRISIQTSSNYMTTITITISGQVHNLYTSTPLPHPELADHSGTCTLLYITTLASKAFWKLDNSKLGSTQQWMTVACCQDHILTENIWFVWSETSYSGDERRCYRCGTTKRTVKIELLSQWKLEAEFRNFTKVSQLETPATHRSDPRYTWVR